ncbi:MATE family efflux transporter [Aquihabitans sp. G128]|uniref:MATE family efflux transporter n=1 Tax=Aquihabitans sp. G128 TaxID=2849779 RepID=UPI001C2308FF|nr:MATE family efflux transporter [Aquihabitans sp. G128]QXC62771.1 MATE family efflux transporter [Aquihabitans sp. G128]
MPDRRYDREILRLAGPAFVTLLAEPIYLLADTAVVGHLGTAQLGGLAVASSILLTSYSLCIFLAYGTTAAVARLLGAGDRPAAARQAVQGLWLGGGVGVALAALLALAGRPLIAALGAEGAVASNAFDYLRLSLAGLPFLLLTLAGTGYLRGIQDTRTPLLVAIGTAVLNLALELVLVVGLDQGIGASAVGTVAAQVVGGLVYVRAVGRAAQADGVGLAPDLAAQRRLLRVGADLVVRTAALRGSLVALTAVATRIGRVDVAAHQIVFEVWNLLAMGLDALAIAGQAMVGRLLGAGDPIGARAASKRLLVLGVAGGAVAAAAVVVVSPVLPRLFSPDPDVVHLAGFLLLWVAALQPLGAVAFVLDGVLIGAGDQRFLARAMALAAAGLAVAVAPVLPLGLGIGWVWAAFAVLMAIRAASLLARFRGDRWLRVGAVA